MEAQHKYNRIVSDIVMDVRVGGAMTSSYLNAPASTAASVCLGRISVKTQFHYDEFEILGQ